MTGIHFSKEVAENPVLRDVRILRSIELPGGRIIFHRGENRDSTRWFIRIALLLHPAAADGLQSLLVLAQLLQQCLSSLVLKKRGNTLTVLNTATHYVSWVLNTN
jgi:hypothetical protein